MPEQKQEIHPLDDPQKRGRVVRMLLFLSPFAFALCYLLAAVQAAEARHCLLIGAIATAACLAAAGVIHTMGSKSWIALVAVKIALALAARR